MKTEGNEGCFARNSDCRNRGRALGRCGIYLFLSLFLLFVFGCRVAVQSSAHGIRSVRNSSLFHQGRHGPLNKKEKEWAKLAWKYFQNNYNPQTGLVNGIDGVPQMTMWDMADYIAALLAARRLALIDEKEFHDRFTRLLQFLNTMPLAGKLLPNLIYSTDAGAMLTAEGTPGEAGWSAMDLGRLLIWLRIARGRYPQYAEYIDRVILRWDFCSVLDSSGLLYGGVIKGDKVQLTQEGRLGYEEYAAMGYQIWGFNTEQASRIEPFLKTKIYGIELLYDGRDDRLTGTFAPIVSLPYLLSGLEFNWDRPDDHSSSDVVHTNPDLAWMAENVYRVQEARYQKARILTARTDHRVNRPPYRVLDTIFVAGYPWNTISMTGTQFSQEALVSTETAFGFRALWKTHYVDRLMETVQFLYEPEKGWDQGRLETTGAVERTFTARTNAMVLETLFYQLEGKLYFEDKAPTLFQTSLSEAFQENSHCFPEFRRPH